MTGFQAYKSALQWHLDSGADEALADSLFEKEKVVGPVAQVTPPSPNPLPMGEGAFLGKSEARAEAEKLAAAANTLEELRDAIAAFEGMALKKTATNMVFSDGNPKARVMLVGEAPGADEDRIGKPFVGASGQLLDKILKCIDLARTEEDPAKAVYISNILNWRPPGNRTPSPAEIEISLPFIEKHIALVQPKILILCGGVSAKALLATEQSVSRLRGRWQEYSPSSALLKLSTGPIPAIVTFHPAYLLRTPAQKRGVWQDMLAVQEKMTTI